MKLSAAFFMLALTFAGAVSAAEVNPNAKIASWNKHSPQEKLQYARAATLLCTSASCTPVDIKTCLDTISKPPIPAAARGVSIGELAVQCISILNR